jgi:hypothetical protein
VNFSKFVFGGGSFGVEMGRRLSGMEEVWVRMGWREWDEMGVSYCLFHLSFPLLGCRVVVVMVGRCLRVRCDGSLCSVRASHHGKLRGDQG